VTTRIEVIATFFPMDVPLNTIEMRLRTVVLLTLFCLCAAAVVVSALTPTPSPETSCSDHVIRTSAVGTIVSSPDRAEIQIGVETEDLDVKAAQSLNAERMMSVTGAIRSLGIPDDHLTTSGYTITPVYETKPTVGTYARQKPTMFRVSNVLLVRIDDVSRVGEVIDAAVASDANRVNSIAFMFSEEKEQDLRAKALTQAVERGRADAVTVASALGVRLLDAHEVQVDPGFTPIAYERSTVQQDAAMTSTPIEPGTLEVSATVQVAWAYA